MKALTDEQKLEILKLVCIGNLAAARELGEKFNKSEGEKENEH
ncbi:MAG: hypothetical protein ACLTWK_00220 [Eisenbergiella sp.]